MSVAQRPATEAAGIDSPKARRPWLGPLVTVAACAVSELLGRQVFHVPGPLMTPTVLGLTAMVFAVFHGGLGPGLVSAAIVVAYSAWGLPGPGQSYQSAEVFVRLVVLSVSVAVMVAIVAGLKRQAVAGAKAETERRTAQAHAEELQASNEELTAQTEELQHQSEELQSQQEELEDLTDSLRRALDESRRGEEARTALEALQRTEALKDQFLAVLSHELRTPINAVTGFGSILQDEIAGPLNDAQRIYLAKMLTAADGLLSLVDDLLDMSRIQAGKFSVEPGPMRFETVAERAIATLRPLADQKSLRLAAELAEELPGVMADDLRIGQVLLNLINNAIKFTPPGGHIVLVARRDGDGVRAEVRDDGPGIPPEEQGKLFHRFTQLDMTPTRQVGGVGLGLSICKALVEAHGGQIGVESRPGAGSTFWFWLPVEPALQRKA